MDVEPKVTASSMKSFLKDVDSNGGIEKRMNDTSTLRQYLMYCNSLLKPRKMLKAVKIIIKNEPKEPKTVDKKFSVSTGN